MTPFERWCDENGFDPKGEFELIVNTPLIGKGDVVTLAHDDSTNTPQFSKERRGCHFIHLHHLTQHKTEPKMTEQKLPIPRMVEVRERDSQEWEQRELLADLSEFGVAHPYICRHYKVPTVYLKFKQMREIPQPKTRPMTPRELLDAIRGGAVWRYENGNYARWDWNSEIEIRGIEICHDWHGTENDIWVKAEVTE